MTTRDDPDAIPILSRGLGNARIVWRCGWCHRYLPLPDLWTHMEAHHGIVRSPDNKRLIQQPFTTEEAA